MTDRRKLAARLFGIAAGAAAAGVAHYALRIETDAVGVSRLAIELPHLPPALDGLSILFLADPHVIAFGERERRTVDLCSRLEPPEMIVWGGDFLGASSGITPAVRLVREITQLFPDTPTYAIFGNAEHKIRPERAAWLAKQLEDEGVDLLVNRRIDATFRRTTITIAGVDDPYYGWADPQSTLADLPPDRFTLLLAHSPQIAPVAARAGVDLMLSGHTHGGQVRVPGLGAIKTQNPLSRRFDEGVFDRARLTNILGYDPGGDLVTYITRGIGLANIPRLPWLAPRLFCPPELTRLVLRRGPS